MPLLVLLVSSYVNVMDEGQGGHQRHSNGALGVTTTHKGPCNGEWDHIQEGYGTAPAQNDQWGGPKRCPRKHWRDKEAHWDRGEKQEWHKLRNGHPLQGSIPGQWQLLGGNRQRLRLVGLQGLQRLQQEQQGLQRTGLQRPQRQPPGHQEPRNT